MSDKLRLLIIDDTPYVRESMKRVLDKLYIVDVAASKEDAIKKFCGDEIIVINAEKIRTTGRKLKQKKYHTYSGYPSGLKTKTLETMLKSKPANVLRLAVKNMLPKTRLGRKMFKKLKVYAGDKHPHASQSPEELKI